MMNEKNGQARFLSSIFYMKNSSRVKSPPISILISIHRNQTDASDFARKSSRKMRLNYIKYENNCSTGFLTSSQKRIISMIFNKSIAKFSL